LKFDGEVTYFKYSLNSYLEAVLLPDNKTTVLRTIYSYSYLPSGKKIIEYNYYVLSKEDL